MDKNELERTLENFSMVDCCYTYIRSLVLVQGRSGSKRVLTLSKDIRPMIGMLRFYSIFPALAELVIKCEHREKAERYPQLREFRSDRGDDRLQ